MIDTFEDSFVRAASVIGGDDYAKVARSLLRAEDVTDEGNFQFDRSWNQQGEKSTV